MKVIASKFAFTIGVHADVDAALTRVTVVSVVGTGPKEARCSVAIVPPRFLYAAKLQWRTETVILQ